MNKTDFRIAILAVLRSGDMTAEQIIKVILPSSAYRSFQEETIAKTEARKILTTLKLEHYIWFTDGKYTLTSKGRTPHG